MGSGDGGFRVANQESHLAHAKHCTARQGPADRRIGSMVAVSFAPSPGAAHHRALAQPLPLPNLEGTSAAIQDAAGSVNQQLKATVIRSPSPWKGLTSCSTQEGNITSWPASRDRLAICGPSGS